MKKKLRQVGSYWGNKGIKKRPNLKIGEFLYYDNPNVIHGSGAHIEIKSFKSFFEKLFPDYEVIIKKFYPIPERDNFFYEIDKIIEKNNPDSMIPPVENKAYICFREAKHGVPGLLFKWHDAKVYIYQERFVRKKKKQS